ncbi:hypothetical protein [Mycobacterium mantenii]|uniref:hypothetical protein n=1 Tax=Mycobacterium mantenii TaxID=560555 RepID=UPI000A860EFA|nr:hypothetical protein [Mycobacterium mantenii]
MFEHIGEYFDDVLVSPIYGARSERAVAAINALPSWARRWDAAFEVWRIHPGYADRLAINLSRLGFTVGDGNGRWSSRRNGARGRWRSATSRITCHAEGGVL